MFFNNGCSQCHRRNRDRNAERMIRQTNSAAKTIPKIFDGVQVGDYVLIHAGFAIERIDEDEAQLTLKALREALDMGLTAE